MHMFLYTHVSCCTIYPLYVYLSTGYSSRWHGSWPQKQLDITFTNGLTLNTWTIYIAGQHRHLSFCQDIKAIPIPASVQTLLLFATHLADSNITYSTTYQSVHINYLSHACDRRASWGVLHSTYSTFTAHAKRYSEKSGNLLSPKDLSTHYFKDHAVN